MDFKDIPFSEIEAQIIVEVGTWKNFDEIEECLILDELMLLMEALAKKSRNSFRMMAASNGYDIPEEEDDEMEDRGDDDLPPEIIEAERALQVKKAEMRQNRTQPISFISSEDGLGLGYEPATDIMKNIDQNVI